MRIRIIFLALAALAAVGCSKSDGSGGGGKLDPSAKVYIVPGVGVKSDGEGYLSAKEIVETAELIRMSQGHIGVADWNRDITNIRFIVGSDWVINQKGELTRIFIGSRDYIFTTLNEYNRDKDTIAYIPNAIMIKAEADIAAAYNAGNYTECYKLLQEAFAFQPTTGAEYKELKAQGKN